MGGRRQSRWLRTADGFAVCGFRATLARGLLPLRIRRDGPSFISISGLGGSRGPLVSLLSLRDLQAAKRLMINRHGDVLGQIRLPIRAVPRLCRDRRWLIRKCAGLPHSNRAGRHQRRKRYVAIPTCV